MEKTEAAATLGARLKGVVARVGESLRVGASNPALQVGDSAALTASGAEKPGGKSSFIEIRRIGEFLKEAGIKKITRREIVEAFNQGTQIEQLADDMLAYRYYGNSAKARGSWLTENPLADPVSELALPEGNAADNVAKWVIPKGTKVIRGTVAPNFERPGGASQVYVPDPTVLLQEVSPR